VSGVDQLRRAAPLAECRLCHLPIRFVKLDTGKALPVNPRPDERGNVAARLQGGRLVGFVISRDHRPGPLDPFRFYPHHATCEELEKNKKSTPPPPEPDPALF